jgi:hypothetical protein
MQLGFNMKVKLGKCSTTGRVILFLKITLQKIYSNTKLQDDESLDDLLKPEYHLFWD